jgi:hypothetical protein
VQQALAVTGFQNIGNQLIRWLRPARKPALMPMHTFMRRQVHLLSYLKGDYLCRMMDTPTLQEKSEKIFFAQPKVHQYKFANLNKMVPTNPLRMIAFFEQCQATDKAAGVLEKIAKDKKQPKERKTAHTPAAHSHESSTHQHRSHKYHQSDRRNRDNCQPGYHHQDNQCHDRGQHYNKGAKSNKSYDKKNDCKCDCSKKKSNKAMHNDQASLSSTSNLSGRRSQSCSRSSLRSRSWSRFCSSSQSYDNHHVNQDDGKPSAAPKRGYSYSKDKNNGYNHCPDKSDTVFATFSALKANKKCTQNRELSQ